MTAERNLAASYEDLRCPLCPTHQACQTNLGACKHAMQTRADTFQTHWTTMSVVLHCVGQTSQLADKLAVLHKPSVCILAAALACRVGPEHTMP